MLYLMSCSDRRVFDVVQPLAQDDNLKYPLLYCNRGSIVKATADFMIMPVDLVLSNINDSTVKLFLELITS